MDRYINVAYIGGGSRGWARTFMTDLALQADFSGMVRLYDIDRQAAADNAIIGARVSEQSKTVFSVTTPLFPADSGDFLLSYII